MKKLYRAFIFIIAMIWAGSILAQQLPTTVKSEPEKSSDKRTSQYSSMGRQDPFIDLEIQKKEKEKVEEAKAKQIPSYEERQRKYPGLRGMLIKELILKGIVQRPKEYIGFCTAPDGRAHFLHVGDGLFNAKITQITKSTLLFEEYKEYLSGKVETSIITVQLHEKK